MESHSTTLTPELVEPLLTVDELADLLRSSRSGIYRLVRDGHLRPYRVGARMRFSTRDVRDYLDRERER